MTQEKALAKQYMEIYEDPLGVAIKDLCEGSLTWPETIAFIYFGLES